MPRTLDARDLALVKKLAPELEGLICEHAEVPFKSILPPLANHIAPDVDDFERRLSTMTEAELQYLVTMILAGAESLSCVPPSHAEVFISLVAARISHEAAEKIMTVYLDIACGE